MRALGARRVPRLGLIGILIAIAIGAALWFALAGPATRAGAIAGSLSAVASATAALTALYLSSEALARTDKQLAISRRATILSRYPLLVPVHQSVAFPESVGNLAAHPPTLDRYRLSSPGTGAYAFIADTNDRFIIPVENAGEGPALRVTGFLWRNDGFRGQLSGPSVLGAGKMAIMTARLIGAREDLPMGFSDAVGAIGNGGHLTYYWLELSYVDVFSNSLSAATLFDPQGLGRWLQVAGPSVVMETTTSAQDPW